MSSLLKAARGASTLQPLRSAFTLMELLVLVAIVALSAVILAPAARHAALTPNEIVCQGNLRAIGVANMLYADDNNDCLIVAVAQYVSAPPNAFTRQHWFNLLSTLAGGPPTTGDDYYNYPAAFHGCPDFQFSPSTPWTPGYGVVMPIFDRDGVSMRQYSTNAYNEADPNIWGPLSKFHRRAEVLYPGIRGWAGDSSAWHMGGEPSQKIYDPAYGLYPYWSQPGIYGSAPARHGTSSNILFADGRVQAMDCRVSGWAFADYTKMPHRGDFNNDGVVDQGDYTRWADHYGQDDWVYLTLGSGKHDGVVDQADYTIWADNYGQTYPH